MKWKNQKPIFFHSYYHKNESSAARIIATVSGNNSNSCTLQMKNPKLPLPKYILMDSSKSLIAFARLAGAVSTVTVSVLGPATCQHVWAPIPRGITEWVSLDADWVARCMRISLVWRWPVLLQIREDPLAFRAACAKLETHFPSESASDNSFPIQLSLTFSAKERTLMLSLPSCHRGEILASSHSRLALSLFIFVLTQPSPDDYPALLLEVE